MILLLLELDACLITLFMFQEHYGIHLSEQEPEQDYLGAHQGAWDLDFLRH